MGGKCSGRGRGCILDVITDVDGLDVSDRLVDEFVPLDGLHLLYVDEVGIVVVLEAAQEGHKVELQLVTMLRDGSAVILSGSSEVANCVNNVSPFLVAQSSVNVQHHPLGVVHRHDGGHQAIEEDGCLGECPRRPTELALRPHRNVLVDDMGARAEVLGVHVLLCIEGDIGALDGEDGRNWGQVIHGTHINSSSNGDQRGRR